MISIHAPREGGDITEEAVWYTPDGFQSTPPARGATSCCRTRSALQRISIHAPREGGDLEKPDRIYCV